VIVEGASWLQILLFAESKDYEGIKPLYLEAAKQFKGKVLQIRYTSSISLPSFSMQCPEIRVYLMKLSYSYRSFGCLC